MDESKIAAILAEVTVFLEENGEAIEATARRKGCLPQDVIRHSIESNLRHELTFGPLRLDLRRKLCYIEGEEQMLSHAVFTVLTLLMEDTEQSVSRETFYDLLWKTCERKQRSQNLRTLMCRLRPKLQVVGVGILHERKGYRLVML